MTMPAKHCVKYIVVCAGDNCFGQAVDDSVSAAAVPAIRSPVVTIVTAVNLTDESIPQVPRVFREPSGPVMSGVEISK